MTRPIHRRLAVISLVAMAAALGRSPSAAFAQSKPAAAPQPASAPGGQKPAKSITAVELASDAVTLESVGLTFYPPVGAAVDTDSIGGVSTLKVRATDNSWLITIQSPRTANPATTAAEVADSAAKQLLASAGMVYDKRTLETKAVNGELFDVNHNFVIPGSEISGEQFFVRLPQGSGEPSLIRGYTVFKIGRDQFLTFELFTGEKEFATAKASYLVSLHGATIQDPTTLAVGRASAIEAGLKLLSQVTADDYRQMLTSKPERWERLSRPAATGADSDAEEVAYRRIRTWIGKRGEVNSKAKPTGFSSLEQQEGYLIRIDARFLKKQTEGTRIGVSTVDSESVFFMSPDRKEEAWSVRLAERRDGKVSAWTETGARSGKSMTVTTAGTGNPGSTVKPLIQGDGYITRVESYLLPQMLVHMKLPADYAFYAYRSDNGSIRLRRDVLEQPVDRPGLWRIVTKLGEDKETQTSLYRENGELLSTTLPDGSVWEPIELEKLARLWRNKNLPME